MLCFDQEIWLDAHLECTHELISVCRCVFFEQYRDKEELGRRCLVFVKLLKRHVRGGGDEEVIITEDLADLIGSQETIRVLSARNRPVQVGQLQPRPFLLVNRHSSLPAGCR